MTSFTIAVDVIPGISSATSLALLQDVPLTRREISESFWVLTGSTSTGKLSKDIELAMNTSATLVILMGIKKIPQLAKMLKDLEKGELPIMVIQNGSLKNQKVLVSNAESIVKDVEKNRIGTPGIIIIGEVVNLYPRSLINKYSTQWNSN